MSFHDLFNQMKSSCFNLNLAHSRLLPVDSL